MFMLSMDMAKNRSTAYAELFLHPLELIHRPPISNHENLDETHKPRTRNPVFCPQRHRSFSPVRILLAGNHRALGERGISGRRRWSAQSSGIRFSESLLDLATGIPPARRSS